MRRNYNWTLRFLAALSGLLCGGCAPVPKPDPTQARVDSYLAEQRAVQKIPGMSASIVVDGRMVWSKGYGLADVENNVPATPKTVYRIASVSSMITSVAFLNLVQSGKISLNASLRDFVPELSDQGHRITVHHVLVQQSGIRGFVNSEEFLNRKHYRRFADAVEYFADDRLIAPPGERFQRSAYAYTALGVVIERASGVPFGEFVDKNVFQPAGMRSTGLEKLEMIIPHRARGYVRDKNGGLHNSFFADLSDRFPGDGMVSTVEDLARFVIAIESGQLINQELWQVMTTAHKTNNGLSTEYGMGCFVREEEGMQIIGHGGWQPQASAFLLIVPKHRVAVIILANLERVDLGPICLRAARMIIEAKPPAS